ncbi:hypothetical protein DID88_007536 [Monilinia fructigena]|uniref:Uncharacterized protein n=1 Tax=Monilinia fructigena TaxID=38457 RepID=A0A395J515_9HELO|nr:hypothetical protein DID88_007536 [Monilinia fructigena]
MAFHVRSPHVTVSHWAEEQSSTRHAFASDVNQYGEQVHLWRQRGNSTSDPNVPRSRESTYAVQVEQAEVNLAPVDDAASIRENRFLDGQVYYNIKGDSPTDVDLRLMSQPRQFNDAPALPYMTVTNFQAPATANDAIEKWMGNADTFSIISRAATWGTRRRSEPSLKDFEAVADGSFLKKLSIKQEKKGSGRWHNLSSFRQRAVIRVSNSNRIKRSRSSSNLQEDPTETNPKQNNSNSLAPPPRSSSFGKPKKPTPSLNTAIAAMTGTVAAVGTSAHQPPQNRKGSLSAVSPKSPLLNLSFLGPKRGRSKSDLSIREGGSATSVSAIGELWKRQGGPPVPTLAPRSSTELESAISITRNISEPVDQDEEDDEEDEQGDEGDMKVEPAQSEPIVPTYEGFKEHVRRLNPDMNPKFSWLVSRIAHQQEIRYKNLLDQRVKHMQAIKNHNCSARSHCIALGGNATLFDGKGKARENDRMTGGLQLITDFSDDSNPGDGALTSENFPQRSSITTDSKSSCRIRIPVEQNLTPITPIGRTKLEDLSPYGIGNISPNIPMVPQFSAGFHQPAFYPTSGPSTTYGMQNSMAHTPIIQAVSNEQFPMFSDSYNFQQMNQPQQFGSMDPANLNNMHHAQSYASIDTGFVNNKTDQSRSDFGTIDTSFTQNKVDHQPRSNFTSIGSNSFQMQANQSFNHTPHSAIDISMTQPFVTTSPPVSSYQAPNMLGMADPNTFGFDSLTVGPMANFQVPMSRGRGSSSPYDQSSQNMQYYGHQ